MCSVMDKGKASEAAAFVVMYLFSLFAFSDAMISNKMGINYGRVGNNLPSANRSIEILKTMKASRVKIYDANPEILNLLSGTKLYVSITVTNDEISCIASNQTMADEWVTDNVLAYYPNTKIRFILVGNEVLSLTSQYDKGLWLDLVPAMQKLRISLKARNISNIKVGTPLGMDTLETIFPPSSGKFRSDISQQVMMPLLNFLNRTKSFFFVDVYPYISWSKNPDVLSLDFALFKAGNQTFIDTGSGLIYRNLLDQMLDSVIYAMRNLGFGNVMLAISETGWPNAGDIDQIGASVLNAGTYNSNLLKKITAKPPIGTPARPGVVIPSFIYSLYDENQKVEPGTVGHWGLLYPNGTPIYDINLSGKGTIYARLPDPSTSKQDKEETWCVASANANQRNLSSILSFLCGQGQETCDALAPGKNCYEPVSITAHVSYALSSFWAEFRSSGATCDFNGLSVETTKDPSHGTCKFPSVSV